MSQEGTKHMRFDSFEPEGIESFDLAGTSLPDQKVYFQNLFSVISVTLW